MGYSVTGVPGFRVEQTRRAMQDRKPETPSRGFTLVELLVVMALLTILVAVLLPVAVQSRNRARAAACLSNLRQIGNAVQLYTQDWSDRLPRLDGTAFAGSVSNADWPEGSCATLARLTLEKRTAGGKVFRCPNDMCAPEYGFPDNDGPVYARAGSSYLPWSTVRAGRFGTEINGAAISSVWPASAHLLMRDYGSNWHGYRTRSGMIVRAVERANALFADGHVKAAPVFSFSTGRGEYVCTVTANSRTTGFVTLAGTLGTGCAELTGKFAVSTNSGGLGELDLSLSGAVEGEGPPYEVDRIFSFGSGAELQTALRQVVYWVESLIGT